MKRLSALTDLCGKVSPPTRGRGLKHIVSQKHAAVLVVAPHAGAWIETCCSR